MTVHDLLTNGPLVQRAARTLAHTVWQGAAAAALVRGSFAVLRSARWRYAAAVAGLAAVVVAAVATFAMAGEPARVPGHVNPVVGVAAPPLSAPGAQPLLVTPRPTDGPSATALLVLAWATGVAAQAAWQAVGWTRIRRLAREPAVVDDRWAAAMATVADRLGVRRAVRLLASLRVDVPVVLGVLRPAVVVPVSLLTELSPDHIQAVLAHELAHVRRHDFLVNLVQCGVEAAFFYHPAIWWMSAVARREREHCCDDLAAEVVGSRPMVAAALVALERRRGPRLAMAATGSSLPARVRRLTAAHLPRRPAGPAVVALVAAVAVVAMSIVTPRPHSARAQPAPPPATRPVAADQRHFLVYVGGDALRRGVYEINAERHRTLRQIVVSAGLPAGGRVWVSVSRHEGDRLTRMLDGVPFASLAAGTPADLELASGDVVRISTADPGRPTPPVPAPGEVYVGGDVDRPGVYSLGGQPMTISQAVIGAGDVSVEHGRRAWVTVYRRAGAGGEVTLADIAFASLLDGTVADPPLQANDVLQVSTSDPAARAAAGKLWTRKYQPQVIYRNGVAVNEKAVRAAWREEVEAMAATTRPSP